MSAVTKGDRAQAEILEAAKHLFLSQGYNGTSMRAIAREAGDRAVAGLYNHFPTKRAIFTALIQTCNPCEALLTTLESIPTDNGATFVNQALVQIMGLMLKHYDFIQLAQIDMREFHGETVWGLVQAIMPRAFAIIQRVQAFPDVRPEETLMLLRYFASVVIGFVLTHQVLPPQLLEQMSAEAWAEKFAQFILYGVAVQSPEPDQGKASCETKG
ncbi:MAG: TetR/AcrR family transcriptional regulator [Anaerolineae bacterium]|nr:TetR/AcrR family transcriptional regulator [Anaerolineae bacterium]